MKVKAGGVWKDGIPWIKVGSTWKKAVAEWVKVGGVWKRVAYAITHIRLRTELEKRISGITTTISVVDPDTFLNNEPEYDIQYLLLTAQKRSVTVESGEIQITFLDVPEATRLYNALKANKATISIGKDTNLTPYNEANANVTQQVGSDVVFIYPDDKASFYNILNQYVGTEISVNIDFKD